MLRISIIGIVFSTLPLSNISAQEISCSVEVNSSLGSEQSTNDKKVFENLQTSVFEFVNNRKWTNEKFLNQEKIECNFVINITKKNGTDQFQATINVQSRRPVYNSSYNSLLINHIDGGKKDFVFQYVEFQPMEFSESTYLSELTSILAFYIYIIIGLDYDSYSLYGGTPYYERAQTVVNNAQNAGTKGWRAHESQQNRYWMVENLLNQAYQPIREAYYKYHRKGMDLMSKDMDTARKTIESAVKLVERVYKERPGAMIFPLFFNAKADELVNIFQKAPDQSKAKTVSMLSRIDPAHSQVYQRIMNK